MMKTKVMEHPPSALLAEPSLQLDMPVMTMMIIQCPKPVAAVNAERVQTAQLSAALAYSRVKPLHLTLYPVQVEMHHIFEHSETCKHQMHGV